MNRSHATAWLVGICGCNGLFGMDDLQYQPAEQHDPSSSSSSTGGGGPPGMVEPPCTPGVQEICYSGAPDTDGVGPCVSGVRFCSEESEWGECIGEVTPTVEDCDTAVVESCTLGPTCGDWVQAKTFGGKGDDELTAMTQDPDGALLLAGFHDEPCDFGGGLLEPETWSSPTAPDMFLAKLDADGEHVWSQSFAHQGVVPRRGLALSAVGGHVTLLGTMTQLQLGNTVIDSTGDWHGYVASFSNEGAFEWAQPLSAWSVEIQDLAIDASGNVYVLAVISDDSLTIANAPIGVTMGAPVLASFSPDGELDTVVPLEMFSGPTTFGSFSRSYRLALDSKGDALVVGPAEETGIAAVTVTVQDDGFEIGSVKLIAEGSYGAVEALDAIPGGDGFIVGGWTDEQGTFVAKLNGEAETSWFLSIADAANWQTRVTAAVARDDGAVVAGEFVEPITLGAFELEPEGYLSAFIARLDADGSVLWARSFGASMDGGVWGLADSDSGNVIVAGNFATPIDFGEGDVTPDGVDVFVAEIAY